VIPRRCDYAGLWLQYCPSAPRSSDEDREHR
jgi:hypothetical protein